MAWNIYNLITVAYLTSWIFRSHFNIIRMLTGGQARIFSMYSNNTVLKQGENPEAGGHN